MNANVVKATSYLYFKTSRNKQCQFQIKRKRMFFANEKCHFTINDLHGILIIIGAIGIVWKVLDYFLSKWLLENEIMKKMFDKGEAEGSDSDE